MVNELALNVSKTKSMLLMSQTARHMDTSLSLCSEDKTIKTVTSVNYLGVVFDKHVSWKDRAD